MRASRLLSLLLLLQNRGRLTAGQLAAELEVSVRTIYRDVEALHAAGVPLYGEAGHDGGYQLLDGFRTRLTGLTEPEAGALALHALPGPAAELGLSALVAASRLKLEAALPVALRERAQAIAQRFHLDATNWYTDGDPSPHLSAVAAAVWEERRITIHYRGWERDVERTVDPYGLVLKGGRWYVVAARPGSARPATYRVNQIVALTTTDERFARPADFDLAAHWQAGVADFRARLVTGHATIRLSPAGRARWPVDDAVEGEHGWCTATIPIESVDHAHGELLRLGVDVEVLDPPELRERMRQTANRLAARYA
ncbi:YafY family protein [Asanoa sp. WMMD1127]|uniref:helix-turn-helix transcriptional regulator n=1 Tax=Asanoa sp. WMMD1127 TaxID=3016107 RepID=UPI0024161DA7|nr:YafY family protein [Asanoa sp. WMMD1127]MDG4821053.1 YafY family protein [Asanoa sp. WMMD1127]